MAGGIIESLDSQQLLDRSPTHVNGEIAKALTGESLGGVEEQQQIDRLLVELDGTDTKSRLGANALLGASLAVAHAAAAAQDHFARAQAADQGGGAAAA